MSEQQASKELLDSIESYYIYRRASEPMAVGSDEERFRMRRLAEETLSNRIFPLFRAAHEPPAAQFDEHDAGIIRDLEAMAANQLAGFWPQALAMGALRLIRQRPAQPPAPARVDLTEHQVKHLLDFIDTSPCALSLCEYTEDRKCKDSGEDMPAGLYVCYTEYPEEGQLLLKRYPPEVEALTAQCSGSTKGGEQA